MPGTVAAVVVEPGQSVKVGDILMTIEAMKMEMPLHSLRDGRVDEILVRPGDAIEAKDLVLIFSK